MVISEESYWLDMWRLLIALLSLFSTLIGIYYATYSIDPFKLFLVQDYSYYRYPAIECIFLIDIFISSLITYRDVDNKVVKKATKIAWNYLTTTFIYDLLSIIPFTLWYFPENISGGVGSFQHYDCYYLLFLLKCLRINKAN